MDLQIYLDDIERRLNEAEEKAVFNGWKDFADGNSVDAPFKPLPRTPRASLVDWRDININDALDDEDLMIISQFAGVSANLENGSDRLHVIRSNYGVGIIPTIFGAEQFLMPYEMNCLPNVKSLNGGRAAIERLIDSAFPDFVTALGGRALSVGERFMKIKSKYPKISEFVRIDHPDCQGPFDICELLYGSDIFVDLYDCPELIHALLRKVTDFYKAFLDKWFQISPVTDKYHAYFGWLHKGAICVRDDSAMNLSPDFYEEFIYPYDYEVLKHFGGGAVHFCGKGDHYIKKMSEMDCLYGIDLSQPHYNDMSFILSNTIDKGINLSTGKVEFLNALKGEEHCLTRLYLG